MAMAIDYGSSLVGWLKTEMKQKVMLEREQEGLGDMYLWIWIRIAGKQGKKGNRK